jgi:phenylalanyl-tRNA synthetase beta subunit
LSRYPVFAEISKYPAIRRDIAVIVDEAAVRASTVSAGRAAFARPTVSVYRGDSSRRQKHSLRSAIAGYFPHLTDSEADALVAGYRSTIKAEPRSGQISWHCESGDG